MSCYVNYKNKITQVMTSTYIDVLLCELQKQKYSRNNLFHNLKRI